MRKNEEAEIDRYRLPIDLLAYIFVLLTCYKDLAQVSSVCRKWKQGVKQSLARREKLSFTGWTMDDDSITRLVLPAYNLKELDMPKKSQFTLKSKPKRKVQAVVVRAQESLI
ncbi:hypothetical protein RJ640_030468 [Escallonia rubra]|uniref:F-box domain-containing protein n=1 Tax=Escallonia rubra TaxID=112253 RepID=A0AA88QE84_9ASTE|nr:hypothetical protein RJ640_030468 [Escallonia rubra]